MHTSHAFRRLTLATATGVVLVLPTLAAAYTTARAATQTMCHGYVATMVGTEGNDRIQGTSDRDVIAGLDGDDVIFGKGGNDIICGGLGNDYIRADAGDDVIYEHSGVVEHLHGDAGDDVIHSAGVESAGLIGGRGADKLYGCGDGCVSTPGGGNDLVSHSGINFDSSNYKVHVDLAKGTATGRGTGHDRLIDVDRVFGTPWNDTILGDQHDNDLHAGSGNDHIAGRGGNDTVDGGLARDTLKGGRGKDFISDDGETGDLPNTPDKAHGGQGDDTFEVGPGANTLHGGKGLDTVEPGVNLSDETVDLRAGTMSYQGFAKHKSVLKGIENVTGSSQGDVIRGDSGPNILIGAGSADRLFGRGGNDTLDAGAREFPPDAGSYADGGKGTDSCRARTKVHCEETYTPPAPPPSGAE